MFYASKLNMGHLGVPKGFFGIPGILVGQSRFAGRLFPQTHMQVGHLHSRRRLGATCISNPLVS